MDRKRGSLLLGFLVVLGIILYMMFKLWKVGIEPTINKETQENMSIANLDTSRPANVSREVKGRVEEIQKEHIDKLVSFK